MKPSAWSTSSGKRCCDLILALCAAPFLLPIIAVTAALVWIIDGSPVFFFQARQGRDGKLFDLIKFRTMRSSSSEVANVTRSGDPRITSFGRLLRRWKIDEFPQLLNVACGEMSFVGPRPELPEYITELGNDAHTLLQVRPGLTGWASMRFYNEEQRLAEVPACSVRQHYVQILLRQKLKLDMEYASRATLLSDLNIVFKTPVTLFLKPVPNPAKQIEIHSTTK